MDNPGLLWGGRFRSSPSPALMRLSRSDASHFRLVPYDLAASLAHGRELVRAGILSEAEDAEIADALTAIAAEIAAGTALPTERDEDVHSFVERLLTERLGTLGGRPLAQRQAGKRSEALSARRGPPSRARCPRAAGCPNRPSRSAWRHAGARL